MHRPLAAETTRTELLGLSLLTAEPNRPKPNPTNIQIIQYNRILMKEIFQKNFQNFVYKISYEILSRVFFSIFEKNA